MTMLRVRTSEESNTTQVRTHPATLLIVDDHLDNVRSLALLLSESGYSVRKATSGEMALETIGVAPPDLVLLDIRMSEMNGYEVCERLKANSATDSIPVIFLSASNDTEDKVRAFAVGGADYVTKPFQAEEVLARVQHQITILRQRQLLVEQNHQLRQTEAALQQVNLELKRIANIDSLTQIANRRCFDEMLDQEWKRLRREQQPLALVLCDIDHFKLYNDRYGHLAGDACLQQVAKVISDCIKRPADIAARYGGEEFAVILPNTSEEGAVKVVNAIQDSLQRLQIPHAASAIAHYVTLSAGVVCSTPSRNLSTQKLIAEADAALYQAKQRRNTWSLSVI
ncbi:diguanylate cyclase [Leptolyngbya sp. FACHB-711]|uniref:diguanylate cyclase domain-containing protein n=2 Tax=Leptolyngbya TaxID=47251 RepID=UPI001F552F82|nr:diguanylate cyclase [Leptolyngbya sp. FACHB-711]